MKGWLDNYNDSKVSVPEGFQGEGYSMKGRNYSPAWGGQFQMGGFVYPVNYVPEAQMGASIPGAVGFTYARTNDPAPSNGPYAKKTKASAQKGKSIPKLDVSKLNFTPSKSTGYAWADEMVKKNKKGLEKIKEIKTKVDNREIAAIKKQYKVDDATAKKWYNNSKNLKQEQSEVRAYTPQSTLSKAWDVVTNPMTALGYIATNQDIPDNFTRGQRNNLDIATDIINPLAWVNYAGHGVKDLSNVPGQLMEGDFKGAGTSTLTGAMNLLGAVPIAQELKPFVPSVLKTLPKAKNFDVFNNIRPPKNILVDEKYMGNNAMLNALDDVKSTTLPSKTKLNKLQEAIDHDELWKYPDINPIDEIQKLKKAAKTEADIAYINALEKQYDKSVTWHDPSRNRANPVFITGQSLEDLLNPAFKNPQGDQWFAIQPFRHVEPKGKNLGYIADEADYIHASKYRLPGNRFDTEGMMKDIGDDASIYFNDKYKPFNVNIKDIPLNRNGGIIKDDLGQWAHPGEITEIGSNNITMKGVPYDVLGISDEGDIKHMKANNPTNYKYKGNKVTEFPMAKNGLRQEQKGLVNLDNLTNFTNYNTKQPGGWLDKY